MATNTCCCKTCSKALHLVTGEGEASMMGPAAMAFIQRAFPLFVAPWEAKAKLEAAGVDSCQEVRPSTVRHVALGERGRG